MSGQPILSIIVPVYNREAYLKRCLESLMNQTMKEIEVLIIDDGSTDQTPEITAEFQRANPERIRSFRTENRGSAKARNLGMKEARGKYITFVDSDDYVEADAYENICRVAQEESADVLCAPAYRWEEGECQIIGHCPEGERDKTSIIYCTTGNLWNKLFRREFLQRTGLEMPDLVISEDASFVMAAMTWADKVSYVDNAYYHYELSENSLSLATKERPWIVELVKTQREWLLTHINDEYHEVIREVLQKQFLYFFQNNQKYQDQLWEYLKQEQKFYLNEEMDNVLFPNPGKQIKEILFSADQLIPQIVYLNGFDPSFDIEKQAREIERSLFVEPCEIRVLTQDNCAVENYPFIQNALEQKNYELVGAYFGMEDILNSGGMYIGNRICILDKWNGLRVNRAFFGLDVFNTLSLQIFGGAANNTVMKKICSACQIEDSSQDIFQELLEEILREDKEDSLNEGDQVMTYENEMIKNKDLRIYKTGVFVLPEYGIMSLGIYQDYNSADQEELRQYVFMQTRKAWKERKAWEREFIYTKNKAYKNTLWQQKQRKNLQEKLEKQQIQQENLLEKLERTSQDLSWMQNQREHLQKKVEKAARDIAWQQDQRENLQKKLNKASQDISWLQNQRENLQERLNTANKNLEWIKDQNKMMQTALDETEAFLLDQKNENAQLKETYNRISQEKELLEQSFSYRLGRALTWIPRRIRQLIRGNQ